MVSGVSVVVVCVTDAGVSDVGTGVSADEILHQLIKYLEPPK